MCNKSRERERLSDTKRERGVVRTKQVRETGEVRHVIRVRQTYSQSQV